MANTDHYGQSDEHDGRETPADISRVISASEINQQIATAKAYPRKVSVFLDDARKLVTLNTIVAEQCTYMLKRGNKTIEGPSARFAEIINNCWGNIRSAARVVDIGDEYVTAEAICYDLEKNNAIRFEVMRRITDSEGRRYNADMIGVTGNAACSIAYRNAVLKVIPKAFWQELHEDAKRVARGDEKTFATRRNNVLETFKAMGVAPQQIYDLLGIAGLDDLNRDHMVTLAAILTAIKDGDTTVEEQFGSGSRTKGGAVIVHPATKRNEFRREQRSEPQTVEGTATVKDEVKPKDTAAAAKAEAPKQEAKKAEPAPVQEEREPGEDEGEPESEERTDEDQRADFYDDWFRDQMEAVGKAQTAADVMDIFDQILPNLEGEKIGTFEASAAGRIEGFIAEAKSVRDISAVRQAVKDRFNPDLTKKIDRLCDARSREVLAATSKAPAKGKR